MRLLLPLLFFALPIGASTIAVATAGPNTTTQSGVASINFDGVHSEASASPSSAAALVNANCGDLAGVVNLCTGEARGVFADEITIFGLGGLLQINVMRTAFKLDQGIANGNYTVGAFHGAFFEGGLCPSGCPDSGQAAFSDGVRLTIAGSVFAMATDFAPNDPLTGSGFAQANLRLLITGATNTAGQPLSGFRYASASGTDYAIPGGAFVPEPATLGIAFAGLVLALPLRRVFEQSQNV
jgi:hypothetical protein